MLLRNKIKVLSDSLARLVIAASEERSAKELAGYIQQKIIFDQAVNNFLYGKFVTAGKYMFNIAKKQQIKQK